MIVLISGKAGSGKSTLKDALIVALSRREVRAKGLRFAGPLYEASHAVQRALTSYGLEFLEKDRVLLQVLGTEWGRASRGKDVWVRMLSGQAQEAFRSGYDVVVVDDCRFDNEKDFDYGVGKITVRLVCPDFVRTERLGGRLPPEHASEPGLDAAQFMFTFSTTQFSSEQIAGMLLNSILGKMDDGGER